MKLSGALEESKMDEIQEPGLTTSLSKSKKGMLGQSSNLTVSLSQQKLLSPTGQMTDQRSLSQFKMAPLGASQSARAGGMGSLQNMQLSKLSALPTALGTSSLLGQSMKPSNILADARKELEEKEKEKVKVRKVQYSNRPKRPQKLEHNLPENKSGKVEKLVSVDEFIRLIQHDPLYNEDFKYAERGNDFYQFYLTNFNAIRDKKLNEYITISKRVWSI